MLTSVVIGYPKQVPIESFEMFMLCNQHSSGWWFLLIATQQVKQETGFFPLAALVAVVFLFVEPCGCRKRAIIASEACNTRGLPRRLASV